MLFEGVAGEYEAGRPSHPAAVYDLLEPLDGRLLLDGGAGTGIASRQLAARGADVVGFDVGRAMLGRAGLPRAVRADAAVLPFRDGCAELVCFAQSWHWVDHERAVPEVRRVLRPGGRWAGWWSHARADGEPWFDAYQDALEAACPAYDRRQRDTDWGATFGPATKHVVPWVRDLTAEQWLVDERSKSYVAALAPGEQEALLAARFPGGPVPYETWVWISDPAG